MKRKRFSEGQIIGILNEAEQTGNIREVCRLHNISEQTFYRWRTKFGGMDVSEAKRLKELERENAELKKRLADLSLDNRMLKELNSKKSEPGGTTKGSRALGIKAGCERAPSLPGDRDRAEHEASPVRPYRGSEARSTRLRVNGAVSTLR